MKRALQTAALAVASLVVFWGLVEGGLRLAGLRPERNVNPFFDWSKQGDFWRFQPGTTWTTRVGGHPVHVNGFGVRDRPYDELEPDSYRILVLGDSVTFGHGVAFEDTFVSRLDALLEGRTPPIEVLNGGIPGWATRQQRIYYEQHAAPLKPDVVLVGFVLNDIQEMHRGLIALGPQREALLFRSVTWLARNSAAFATAKRAYESVRAPEMREIGDVRNVAARPDSPEVRRAMELTLGELKQLVELTRRRGARFGLIVFPFDFQFRERDLDTPQRRLERFAREMDVPFLDTLPLLRPHGLRTVLLDHDHLTPEGHRIVAEALAEWLEREELIPP